MAARFVLKKSGKSKFLFNLKAPNGLVILTSESYNDKSTALKGIESVRTTPPDEKPKSAEDLEIEKIADQLSVCIKTCGLRRCRLQHREQVHRRGAFGYPNARAEYGCEAPSYDQITQEDPDRKHDN